MSAIETNHAKGLILTAIGGLTLSFDIPLIRLAGGDTWSILALRSGLTFATALVVWAIWRLFTSSAPKLIPGRLGLLVSIFYGLGSITFITAIYNTSTANLVFILACNPMFAALLAWILMKERPQPATLVAMVAMIVGVLVIVGDSIGTGQVFGDFMALCSALTIALAITISRKSGEDMGFTSLVGVVFPLLVAAVVLSKTGLQVEAPWWIIFNGAVVTPLAFFCLAAGPKYISGPEVAMFYLLETVLAPVWMWMIFYEIPTLNSMIGGFILVVALVAHSIWQLNHGRKRRAAAMVRHPV